MDSADIYIMVLFRYTGAPYILQLGVTKEPSLTPNFTQPIYLYSTVLTGGIVIDGSLLYEIRCPLLTYLCS
jgi:hypothetical protein